MASASRQSKRRVNNVRLTRVAKSTRLGLMPHSTNPASCLRTQFSTLLCYFALPLWSTIIRVESIRVSHGWTNVMNLG